jgi:hypothetical protein
VEVGLRPLAFNRQQGSFRASQDEIDLVATLVAPVANLARLQVCVHLIENQVLPQQPEIVTPKFVPAPVIADRPGIETVNFRADMISVGR